MVMVELNDLFNVCFELFINWLVMVDLFFCVVIFVFLICVEMFGFVVVEVMVFGCVIVLSSELFFVGIKVDVMDS